MDARYISTNELAALFGVLPASIRHAVCLKGHYVNIIPLKLPNRRLRWPASEVERLLRGADGASKGA